MARKKRIGRPPKAINARAVRTMAEVGCTNREIAQAFGVDEDTVHNRFSELIAQSRSKRKERLRVKQTRLALKGDRTMLVWLGKNELGQTDKTDITSGGKSLATLVLASMQPAPSKPE